MKLKAAFIAFAIFTIPTFVYSESNDLTDDGYYQNSDGQEIHRPSHTKSGKAPDGATAKCRDGSYSFSTHHRGTCSRHGGVSEWLN